MKIKFSKVLAIVCAVSVAFAGLTAFAAPGDVTVKTTYDVYKDSTTQPVTVEATIYGEEDKEVTYYVSKGDKIVYINQGTVDNGEVSFTFTTDHTDALTATAKFGTDGSGTFPTFTFADGNNYITQGNPHVALVGTGYAQETYTKIDADGADAGTETGYVFKATVSGNVTEYGIKVGDEYFPAAGCDKETGTFMVVIKDNNYLSGKTIKAYAKNSTYEFETEETINITPATPAE